MLDVACSEIAVDASGDSLSGNTYMRKNWQKHFAILGEVEGSVDRGKECLGLGKTKTPLMLGGLHITPCRRYLTSALCPQRLQLLVGSFKCV